MKEQILEQLQEFNQKTKEILFFNFVLSEDSYSIEINHETFQAKPVEIVGALIESGVNANTRAVLQKTLLFEVRTKEVAELLIQNGADVNARDFYGETPLFHVKSKEVAEVLIQAGADVNAKNEDGFTPLFFAISKEIAELLIQAGADVNIKNNQNRTPIEFQRQSDDFDLADFMEQKATKLEQEKLNQNLPQSQKSLNHPQYRL